MGVFSYTRCHLRRTFDPYWSLIPAPFMNQGRVTAPWFPVSSLAIWGQILHYFLTDDIQYLHISSLVYPLHFSLNNSSFTPRFWGFKQQYGSDPHYQRRDGLARAIMAHIWVRRESGNTKPWAVLLADVWEAPGAEEVLIAMISTVTKEMYF